RRAGNLDRVLHRGTGDDLGLGAVPETGHTVGRGQDVGATVDGRPVQAGVVPDTTAWGLHLRGVEDAVDHGLEAEVVDGHGRGTPATSRCQRVNLVRRTTLGDCLVNELLDVELLAGAKRPTRQVRLVGRSGEDAVVTVVAVDLLVV